MSAPDSAFAALARLVRRSAPRDDDPVRNAVARARFVAWANRPQRRRGLWVATGLVAVTAIALVWWRSPAPLRYEIIAAAGMSSQPAVLEPGTLVRFSDATELEFGSDGRGWLAETTSVGARVVVEDGSLKARVTPRGKARWTVEAGPFSVRVTGTAFKVDWRRAAGRFAITMSHGSVVVEGPGFSQRLEAGQTLEATSAAGLVHVGQTDEVVATTPPVAPRTTPPPRRSRPVSKEPKRLAALAPKEPRPAQQDNRRLSWSRRLALGQFEAVVADAEARGIDRVLVEGRVDDVAALATAARLAQRPAIARQALETQRARFFATPSGREATFYLGWIADESDGDRAAAIHWYDRYLADAPQGALAEEAMGRKLRALVSLGSTSGAASARATARAYLARFPQGAHAALARGLVGEK
ncbi:MAG TPA: FecR domain-containing protein [Polyangia bacterium]